MHENGMRRAHTLSWRSEEEIWRASNPDHSAIDTNRDKSKSCRVTDANARDCSDEENSADAGVVQDQQSIESVIFQTIVNDPVMYSHILLLQSACQPPEYGSKVLAWNQVHKEGLRLLSDAKGVSWTHV